MALLAVLGSILSIPLLVGVVTMAGGLPDAEELGSQLGVLLTGVAAVSLTLSFPALFLISRARDRYRHVTRLREQLAPGAAGGAGPDSALISTEDYDRLARLEEQHAAEALDQSLRRGRKATTAPLYAIQRSLDFHTAIEQLQGDTRTSVERALFELMSEPRPSQARPLAASNLLSLPVPDSSLELLYEPDDSAGRLRIHRLQFARRAGGSP